MVTFPKGIPNPHLARTSLEDDPFPHLEIAPFLYVYHYPFDGQALVDAIEKDGDITRWNAAKVGRGDNQRIGLHRDSRSQVLTDHLGEFDPEAEIETYTELQKAAYPVLYHVERAVWDYRIKNNLELQDNSGWVINKYGHGGQYKVHVDHGTDDPRLLSVVCYLNTVKDGGRTFFPFQNVATDCVEGNIVLFPSSYAYAHASEPAGRYSGETKYSMAAFFT